MASLKQTLSAIKNDLPRQSVKAFFFVYFFSPSFRVLLNYRIGKYFFEKKSFFCKVVADHYKYKLVTRRGCDFSYKASIGKIKLPHPTGIVIGDGVVIKDGVKIWQQVTLGSHGKKEGTFSYPTVLENAKIFAGAKVIGAVTIGVGSVVGANSVVNRSVPDNMTAVGIPCKIF